jgi:streptomycin 6-kinase
MAADAFDGFLDAVRARHGDGAESWCEGAPALHDELALRWELGFVEVVGDDPSTYVVAAVRSGETPVTLEIAYPDAWFTELVGALLAWDGEASVAVIDHDPRGAILTTRPVPGTPLGDELDEAVVTEVACGVAERLWIANPGGITHLAGEALEWARTMPARHALADRPFDRGLVMEAVVAIRELIPTQPEHVLLHGDLRPATIVRADEERWVAVAPRPLVGEQAFDAAGLVIGDAEDVGTDRAGGPLRLRRRVDAIAERLGLDPERLRRWALAVATDYALWDLEAGLRERGTARADVAGMLRNLPPSPEPQADVGATEPDVEDAETDAGAGPASVAEDEPA